MKVLEKALSWLLMGPIYLATQQIKEIKILKLSLLTLVSEVVVDYNWKFLISA